MIRVLITAALAMAAAVAQNPPAPQLQRFPPLSPAEALAAFDLTPGFRIELAATEPEVVDPVAMAFDESGALFVVEMRDYSERRNEKLSRVRRLVDADRDGRFERSTIFLDGLAWATGVACWDGGVLVIASPDIWFARDTDGDGRADEKRAIVTGFGDGRDRLNVQALPNSLSWGPDGRLYGAAAANGGRVRRVENGQPTGPVVVLDGADFSLDPRSGTLRAESGTAQFGLCFDGFGRRFVCSNSRHIQWVAGERRYAERRGIFPLPPALVDIPADGPAAEVFRISPEEPWRVVRTRWRASGVVPGIVEGGGRASGYFTSACGIHVARGLVAPGHAFIGDVGSNLVHRKVFRESPDGPIAIRAPVEEKREFLASRDTWFRPVAFADGPDGALYIADMYREVVEHPDSLPPPLKSVLDLNSGNDRGRIWRIVPDGTRPSSPIAGEKIDTAILVEWLRHPNRWHHETAFRLLLAQHDQSTAAALREKLSVRALAVLRSLDLLEPRDVITALDAPRVELRIAGLRLAEEFSAHPPLVERIAALIADSSPQVRWQAALTLRFVDSSRRVDAIARLIGQNDPPQVGSRLAGTALSALRNEVEAAEIFSRCRPADPTVAMALATSLGIGPRHPPAADLAAVARSLLTSGEPSPSVSSAASPSPAARLAAIAFLSAGSSATEGATDDPAVRAAALNPALPDAVRSAAIQRSRDAAPLLVDQWSSLPAVLRLPVLDKLVLTSAGVTRLLDAVSSGAIPAVELPASFAARLRSHPNREIQEHARDALGAPPANRQSVVESSIGALELPGDATRGQRIFLERCATCHRDGNLGAAVGPDRASFRNLGKPILLVALIDPNREVSPAYFTTVATNPAGEMFVGVATGDDASTLRLRSPGGQEIAFEKEKLARIERQARSLMPDGLEAGLNPQGLADLLEFLVQ